MTFFKHKKTSKNLLALLCICICSLTTSAEEQEFIVVDGIQYRILDPTEKTVEVIENTKTVVVADGSGESEKEVSIYEGNITIPSSISYNGTDYQVKRIGEYAFYGAKIDKITLSSGIESIEPDAFKYSSLREIDLGKIKRIMTTAFGYCEELKNIHFPSSLYHIAHDAFISTGLETISIDDDNPDYYIYDNALYTIGDSGRKWLVLYPDQATQEALTLDPECSSVLLSSLNTHLKRLIITDNYADVEIWNCRSLEEIVFSGNNNYEELWPYLELRIEECNNIKKITSEREYPPVIKQYISDGTSDEDILDFSKLEISVPDEYKRRYALCYPWFLSPSLADYIPEEIHLVGTMNTWDFNNTSETLYRDYSSEELIYHGDVVLKGEDEFQISGEVGSFLLFGNEQPELEDEGNHDVFMDFNYYEGIQYSTILNMAPTSSSRRTNFIVNPKWPKMPVGITANFTTGKITFSTTTIASVDTVSKPDENETVEYYDIMGRPTTKDHKGIVIVVKNGKATKHIQN